MAFAQTFYEKGKTGMAIEIIYYECELCGQQFESEDDAEDHEQTGREQEICAGDARAI